MAGNEQEAEELQGDLQEVRSHCRAVISKSRKHKAVLCRRATDVMGDARLCRAIKPCHDACLAGTLSLQAEIVLLVPLLQTTSPKYTLLVNAPAAISVIHLENSRWSAQDRCPGVETVEQTLRSSTWCGRLQPARQPLTYCTHLPCIKKLRGWWGQHPRPVLSR